MSDKLKIEYLTELGRKILPKGASLWLYGSRARGTARKDSDWDLLVLIDKDKRENSDFMEYTMPFIDLGIMY
ncbi:MAG: nucleotidyltransferase domain-containing protein, partial [Paludibacteraceae bacterium]|nr:nucleotidyltransferase domain-containing protein [Paludibacteraceae bacterium]